MMKLYLRNADAAIIVFDLAKQQNSLDAWVKQVRENENNMEPTILYIVGNKSDLID